MQVSGSRTTTTLSRNWVVPLLLAAAVAALASRSFSTGEAAADLSIPALSRTDVHATPLVAVADLHGDWQNALLSLQLTGAVDNNGHWVGGVTHLVQTGDVVDRGPHSIELVRYLWRLREEAQAAGGRVSLLIGNHEVWAMSGVNNYASATELRAIGGGSVVRGHSAWNEAFDPATGELGRVIADTHEVAIIAGDGACRTLFVHAGILPSFLDGRGNATVAHLTQRFRDAVSRAGAAFPTADKALFGSRGPHWCRNLALGAEREACNDVATVLSAVNATRMVIGHTVQVGGASTRCGGALVLLDAGISSAYYGQATAFQCSDAHGAAIQELGGSRQLPTPPAAPTKYG